MKVFLLVIIGLGLIGIGIILDRIMVHFSRGEIRKPINPLPNEDPCLSEEDQGLLKLYMKEWETIIDTQMHFNDLILRFRSITLTSFLVLVGCAITIQEIAALEPAAFFIIIGILSILWLTAFIIDFGYYHRLLLGSVAQALKFDNNERLQRYGMFGLTTCISEHVHPPTSRILVFIYYFLPVVGISVLFYWGFFIKGLWIT